jgi:hypothetical protein
VILEPVPPAALYNRAKKRVKYLVIFLVPFSKDNVTEGVVGDTANF